MKALMKAALAAVMTVAFAWAGNEGGGGGGICINGKCMTLAQAGVRLKENDGAWKPTPEVRKELTAIANELPFAAVEMIALALGNDNTFQEVVSVNSKTMKRIRADYLQILKRSGVPHSEQDLEIFAVSNGPKTYLLPAFFDLEPREQALTLLHEGIVRNFNNDHRLALVFDGELLD